MIEERHLTDEEILEKQGYKSANVGKAISKSRFGSFFSKIGNSIKNSGLYKSVSNSFVGRALSTVGEKTNTFLNHPAGRLATFALAVGLGVTAVAASGGLALIAPAVGLGAVVVGKTVSVAMDVHRENKIRSLEHQLKLLRTLEDAHHEHTQNLHRGMSEEKRAQFGKFRGTMSSLSAEYTAREGEEHRRNLPTLRGEALKAAAKGIFTIASAAVDLTSLPASVARMAQHAPDVVSKSLDMKDTAGMKQEMDEQYEGAEREAVLKARVNKLAQKLQVPAMPDTAAMAEHVRDRLSLMRATEAVARDHVAGEQMTHEGAMMRYAAYKKEADKDKDLDEKVAEQRKRGGYVRRMASGVSRALFGTREDWTFKKTEPTAQETPDARRDRGGSISR